MGQAVEYWIIWDSQRNHRGWWFGTFFIFPYIGTYWD